MDYFKNLFTPGRIGNLELKNRIVMPPMVTHMTENGEVTQKLINYYLERAKGGAALIVIEAAYPSPKEHPGRLCIYHDKFLPGLKNLVDAIHDTNCKIALEINPSRGRSDDLDPISASVVPHPFTGIKPRALSVNEIQHLIEEFGHGAMRARKAGFDAIVIHGAHGYLISEFLSPRINMRHDQYGGNIKNRSRFALELVSIAKEKTDKNYPIIFRLSAIERLEGGLRLEEAIDVCRLLQNAGVDAIDIVSGATETMEWIVPYMLFPNGYNVELAEEIRKVVNIPILVAGRINDPYLAEEILEKGKTDFVDLGRALIADPQFPAKASEGKISEIRPCIACLRCAESFLERTPLVCTVNPFVGKEKEVDLTSAPVPKNVLVVGGGPGGMQAATVAALKGHRVTLWEKEERLGGQLHLASAPSYKKGINIFFEFLENQLNKSEIEVVLEKKASPEAIFKFKPDVVILATGSLFGEFQIPGVEKNNVVNNWELLSGKIKAGENVVILGGGLAGCEAADVVSEAAKQVSIVEMLDELAADAIEWIKRPIIKRLNDKGIQVFCGVKKEEIVERGIKIEDTLGKSYFLEADQIVVTTGSVSNTGLATKLRNQVAELHEIGDCRTPRRILEAIHEGTRVGLEL